MRQFVTPIVALGCLSAAVLAGVGCAPKRIPPKTVVDLMEDRVSLDGVLMKCNEDPARARDDSDCRNARIAIERLAKDVDPAEEVKRAAEFERSREALRLAQERVRKDQEARNKVDAYSMPIVPINQSPPGAETLAKQTQP
jgi:hypothetical protein